MKKIQQLLLLILMLLSCSIIFTIRNVLADWQHDVDVKKTYNYTYQNHSYNGNGGVFYLSASNECTMSGTKFNWNSATGYGGAVYNLGTLDMKSTNYYSNSAKFGGAFYNGANGKTTINSSRFSLNEAEKGGAIANYGSLTIDNTVFENNKSTVNGGGAIANYGTLTIRNGTKFTSNTSADGGAAIYNGNGTLNLVANTSNIEFTSNTANGVSNAIYDNGRTINLYSSNNASIIFNDRITSVNNSSILNINKTSGSLPTTGKIILNESMNGYKGIVNLYGGELKLQAKTEGNSNINTNKFFSRNINLSSGTLNILNNSIDNITISTLTTTAKANLKFDTDLSNNTSDNFTVTNSATGTLNLTAINILGVNEDSGQITLFNNEVSPELNVLTTANYGGYEYTFTNSDVSGVLNYEKTGLVVKTFKEVVNETEPATRSYSFSEDEIVTEDLGQLGGTQLTIFGNGYEVDGNGKAGIIVGVGQVLNIEDVANVSDFDAVQGGVVFSSNGVVSIGTDMMFNSNNATASGGALFGCNNSNINIGSDTLFSSNTATKLGGAIYIGSNSLMEIEENVEFIDNSAKFGGAIANGVDGILNIGNEVLFMNNKAICENDVAYGGAIYNAGDIIIGESSIFEQNSSAGRGGAIYNSTGTITISSAVFSSNMAMGMMGNYAYGGAIYNSSGTIIISSSVFDSNTAAVGGAIDNSNILATTIIKSTIFNKNIATTTGGALSNGGTLIIEDSSFIDNISESYGGAILNIGILNLIANTQNVEFTGNTANGISNAIHDDNKGTINLWASENADIIFNDRITSRDSTSILNINSSTTTLTANGKVILNEDMSGYTGTVNLYGGEIELQAKINGNSNVNTNKLFSGNINLSSGTLNIQNNAIDNITVSNLTTTENANLKFDTDLSNNTSDNFTVINGATGELNLMAINVLGVDEETGQITLFNNSKAPTLNILTNASYGGYEYIFTNSNVAGVLNYERGEKLDLKNAVNKTEPAIRSYSLSGNEIVTENLGQLGGTQLTVFGNGYEVNGSSKTGITVGSGQILNIEKGMGEIFVWKDFYMEDLGTYGGVIKNGTQNISDAGIVNIGCDIVFSSNGAKHSGGVIYNSCGITNIGYNVIFSSNIVDARGGAICNDNDGVIKISSNAVFLDNKVYVHSPTQVSGGGGGAIFNISNGNIEIDSNVSFISNEAFVTKKALGGAINNSISTTTIKNGAQFVNNSAHDAMSNTSKGGAIYNTYGTTNLIANTSNIVFAGNTANGISNAIHDDNGIINLWASENADIVFNDRITSGNSSSILNINKEIENYQNNVGTGKIVLNEYMSGYTGDVNLYGGEIELQAKTNENSNINTNKFFSGNINLSSGTLNIQNNAIDNITVSNLTTTENANLKFDTDLSNNTSDNFTVTNSATGELNLTAINVLGVNGKTGQITLFNNEISPELNILTTANYNGKEYTFTNSDVAGVLNYKLSSYKTFKETINETEPAIRSYSLSEDEIVLESLGNLGGTQLTVFGNGFEVNGNSRSGIIVGEGQILNIDKGTGENFVWEKFHSDTLGSVIMNTGTLNIEDNIVFSSNSTTDAGGVITNHYNLTIGNNVIFSSNTATNSGGAIRNVSISNIGGGNINIGDNVKFSLNTSRSGGAIYIVSGDVNIGDNAEFNLNTATTRWGGAIYFSGKSISSIGANSIFTSNTAGLQGGAISNGSSNVTIGSNSTFSNNSSGNIGGAIYTSEASTTTFMDGVKFIENLAITQGGAIYNEKGVLNLIANTNNVEFTGNTANGVSNAIHSNGGVINLWASDNASVIFNDRITSSDDTSILNINQSSGTLPTIGKVVLNEDMSGYTGSVILYGGEIELQAETEEGSNINTNKFFGGNITNVGTLNILNNVIDNVVVKNLSTNGNLKFDTDLSNNTSDNFTVTNTAEGTLNLTAINILGTNIGNGQITLFNNEISPELNVLTTANYGGYEYTFTMSDTAGVLNYEQTGTTKTFKEVVNDTIPQYRSYSFSGDEIVTEDLGSLGGTQLTIFGNGYDVDGNGRAGIKVSNGQILNIEKGTGENFVWENFISTGTNVLGSVIYNNNGKININSDVFNENFATGAKSSGSAYSYGGAIYNYNGIVDISSTIFNSSMAQGYNTNGNGYGNGGAIYNKEGIVTVSSTIFNSNTASGLGSGLSSGSRFAYGYGGAIYNDNGTVDVSSVVFSSNDAQGIILNFQYGSGNCCGYGFGGAIYNKEGTVTVSSTIFVYNTARGSSGSYGWSFGGAIRNQGGEIIISSTNFVSNVASASGSGDLSSAGGAIYNADDGSLGISSTTFSFNIVSISSSGTNSIGHGDGGAIYNCNKGIVDISSTIFDSNIVSSSGSYIGYSNGGAICNHSKGILHISLTSFNFNIVNGFGGSSGYGYGGAIYNYNGTVDISSTIFNSNMAQGSSPTDNGYGYGGAIYNRGIIIMDDTKFLNNRATTNGGAIYNDNGILNLIANTNNVEFIGNIANGVSNAIHDKGGTINLWASENADIIFNDRITSENSSSILNINSSTNTLTANGKVVLNEDMSGWTGTTNLYNGNLIITEGNNFVNGDFTIYGGTFTANANSIIKDFTNNGTVDLTGGTIAYNISGLSDGIININNDEVMINDDVYINNNNIKLGTGLKLLNEESLNTSTLAISNGAILNTQNNSTGTVNASSIVIEDGANWTYQIDLDLKSAKADNLINVQTVGNESSVLINDIHLLSDKATKTSIQIADNDINATIEQNNLKIYTTNLSYAVTTEVDSNSNTLLNIEAIGYGGLANAVYDGINSYSVTEETDYLTKWIEDPIETINNKLKGNLNINGNNKILKTTTNAEGLTTEEYTLQINNLKLKGFKEALTVNNTEGILQLTNVEFSNNTGNAVITSSGTVDLSGVIFDNTNSVDIDVVNDNKLILSGSSTTFATGVIGRGTTTISGVDINLADAVIEQNKIEIKDGGSLTANASNITADIENNSNLVFAEGTNNNYIFGTGVTVIDGEVINSSTIVNYLTINENKKLTTNVDTIIGDIENDGNLVFNNNGTNTNYIFGTGTTIIDGEVINSSSPIRNNVTINENKQLTTNASDIIGDINNFGNYVLTGGGNSSCILGDGVTIIDGEVINSSTIVNNVTINENKQLATSASDVTGNINNSGNYVLTGGENSNYIFGNGVTVVDGEVINSSTIVNAITINENKQLTTIASDVTGNINNSGNYVLTGGENSNYIFGNGVTVIDGEVINSSTIVNTITINENKKLITNVDTIIGDIENDGNLVFNNNGTNNNYVFGNGATVIDGEIINSSTIINNVTINENKQLTTNASDIIGDINNFGNYVLTGGGNSSCILGDGVTIIDGEVINSSTIVNNVTINENKQLATSASDVTGNINNSGNYVLTGGENSNYIFGNGVTVVDGEVINSSTIVNAITINENKQLTTNANSIIADIVNNGILLFNAGTINNNRITGLGSLNITVNNFINNNLIEQKNITISKEASNINNAFSLNSQQGQNNFINNSIISAENLNLESINLKLTENGILSVQNFSAQNSEIDVANSILQQHNFKTIALSDDLKLFVDADLTNKEMDTISADNFSGNGKINVKAINILTDAKGNKTEVLFTTSTVLKDNVTTVNTATSKLFKYDVDYDNNTGNINFLLTANNNPVIVESQVASAEELITQTTVLNQAFSSIDSVRNRIAQAKQKGLLYASTTDVVFDGSNRIESGLWIRPFMSQDSISFDSLDVDNTLTGTLAGIDLSAGENTLVSFYLGYAGSNQKYEDIKINQTGYILGATGMWVKDNWYAGLTTNINFNKAESESDYGTDSFDMNMFSVGAKAGYNYTINDKWALEPNLTLMYGNVSNQEYETTQGANIDSQSVANIIAEPQIKAKFALSDGWQPYAILGYLINMGDDRKVVADETEFEMDKIDGYVEYGAGVNKEFINTPWSCYVQVTGRSGGINGFSGNIGVKYSFGNNK